MEKKLESEREKVKNLSCFLSPAPPPSHSKKLTSVRESDGRDRVDGVEGQVLARPLGLGRAELVGHRRLCRPGRAAAAAAAGPGVHDRPDERDERVEHGGERADHRNGRQRVEGPDLDHAEVDSHKNDDPAPEPSLRGAAPARNGVEERGDFLKRDRRGDGVGDGEANKEDDLEGGEEPEAPVFGVGVGVVRSFVRRSGEERERERNRLSFRFRPLSNNPRSKKKKRIIKKKKKKQQAHHLSPKANFVRSGYRSIRTTLRVFVCVFFVV